MKHTPGHAEESPRLVVVTIAVVVGIVTGLIVSASIPAITDSSILTSSVIVATALLFGISAFAFGKRFWLFLRGLITWPW